MCLVSARVPSTDTIDTNRRRRRTDEYTMFSVGMCLVSARVPSTDTSDTNRRRRRTDGWTDRPMNRTRFRVRFDDDEPLMFFIVFSLSIVFLLKPERVSGVDMRSSPLSLHPESQQVPDSSMRISALIFACFVCFVSPLPLFLSRIPLRL